MLARVYIHLPFLCTLPDNETYPIVEYEDQGYKISLWPPTKKSEKVRDLECQIQVDGKLGHQRDVLQIDFQKDTFKRTPGPPYDPPQELITGILQSFVTRLRFVCRAPHVRFDEKILPTESTISMTMKVNFQRKKV